MNSKRLLLAALLFLGCSRERPQEEGSVRIVSAAPALTETLFAIGAGDEVVGRTDCCDWPPETKDVPVCGKFAQPFLEKTLALGPTHLVANVISDAGLADRLRNAGVDIRIISCARVADIPATVRELGKIAGREEQAEREASRLENELASWKIPETKLKVLALVDANAPIVPGPKTFLSEMISMAGGENIVEKSNSDYLQISLDWLFSNEPDAILCLFPMDKEQFSNRPGWSKLKAVKENRIVSVDELDDIVRPGPRIMQGLARLKKALDEARSSVVK